MRGSPLLVVVLSFSLVSSASSSVVVQSAAGRPAAPGPAVRFSYTPEQLVARYLGAQDSFKADLAAIKAIADANKTFANTIRAFESAGARFAEQVQHLMFLKHVSPHAALREAADRLEDDASKFGVALMQDEALYAAIKAAAAKNEVLSAVDARLLEGTLKGFKASGMELAPAQRAELKNLQERLSRIGQDFENNIAADDYFYEASLAELKGLPQSYIDGLPRTSGGGYKITLSYPDYFPVMQHAESGALRKKLELKFNERAAEKNMPLLEESLAKRQRVAALLGRRDYPQLVLEDRMAKSPEKVWTFLNDLWARLRKLGEKDLDQLLERKRRDEPAATELFSWEKSYYAERIRQEQFALDQEEVRRYFSVDRVVSGTMKVYERLLGVKFAEVTPPESWHADARLLELSDAATGRRIGWLYLDLYPRENKYGHAAAFTLIPGRANEDGSYNEPTAAMVANFSKPQGGKPALLKHDEVETFFHEFGHNMHQLLTRARYASFSGTSVATDFVEAPSQIMENLVWSREVLDELSGHWQDPARKLPDDLFKKMLATKRFQQGLGTLRQVSFAMADMLIHTAVPQYVNTMFNQIMELVGLYPIQREGRFAASFGHLLGGYGAGYYGYLWSEVFADDMWTRFEKEGIFSGVGFEYRREILEPGSSRPEDESYRAFLKREPSAQAFIDKLFPPDLRLADEMWSLRRQVSERGAELAKTGAEGVRVQVENGKLLLTIAFWPEEFAPEHLGELKAKVLAVLPNAAAAEFRFVALGVGA